MDPKETDSQVEADLRKRLENAPGSMPDAARLISSAKLTLGLALQLVRTCSVAVRLTESLIWTGEVHLVKASDSDASEFFLFAHHPCSLVFPNMPWQFVYTAAGNPSTTAEEAVKRHFAHHPVAYSHRKDNP